MLMRVPTDFKILGYPGLAIIFFLAAAGGESRSCRQSVQVMKVRRRDDLRSGLDCFSAVHHCQPELSRLTLRFTLGLT